MFWIATIFHFYLTKATPFSLSVKKLLQSFGLIAGEGIKLAHGSEFHSFQLNEAMFADNFLITVHQIHIHTTLL